jgi:hypothetical protein
VILAMNVHTSVLDLLGLTIWDFMELIRDYNAVVKDQNAAMKDGR